MNNYVKIVVGFFLMIPIAIICSYLPEAIGAPLLIIWIALYHFVFIPYCIIKEIKTKKRVNQSNPHRVGVTTYSLALVLKEGLPNFLNDVKVRIILDDKRKMVHFCEGSFGTKPKAALKYDQLISVHLGVRGNTKKDTSGGDALFGAMVAGTTGAVVGSAMGKKQANIPTLTLQYLAKQGEKRTVEMYQGDLAIEPLKKQLDKRLKKYKTTASHVDL